MRTEVHRPGSWTQPRRVRHFDLALQGDPNAGSDSSDSDDGPVQLPIGLGGD